MSRDAILPVYIDHLLPRTADGRYGHRQPPYASSFATAPSGSRPTTCFISRFFRPWAGIGAVAVSRVAGAVFRRAQGRNHAVGRHARLFLSGGWYSTADSSAVSGVALIYMRKYHVPVATVFALVTPALLPRVLRGSAALDGLLLGVPSERSASRSPTRWPRPTASRCCRCSPSNRATLLCSCC